MYFSRNINWRHMSPIMGYRQEVRHRTLTPALRWFESSYLSYVFPKAKEVQKVNLQETIINFALLDFTAARVETLWRIEKIDQLQVAAKAKQLSTRI